MTKQSLPFLSLHRAAGDNRALKLASDSSRHKKERAEKGVQL